MKFSLIGAPLELGCGTVGCSGAFQFLREHGLLSFFEEHRLPYTESVAFSPLTERRADETESPKYLPEVLTACRATRDAVSASLAAGEFPLTFGGDHALGLGTVAGSAEHWSPDELSLVWVDAHTDINTEGSSFSGNIHGMPVAALLGLCRPELSSLGTHMPKIRPENVHIFFARDIDPPEEEIIKREGVNLYRMETIKKEGLKKQLELLLSNIRTPYCHVSWDVDSLDSASFTATGLPIPDGPSAEDVSEVLAALMGSGKAVALDCVEYNPILDDAAHHGCETVLQILKPAILAVNDCKKE